MIRAAVLLALVVALAYAARSFLPADATLTGSGSALAFGLLLLASIQTGHIFHVLRLPHLTGFLLCGAILGPELVGVITHPMVHDLGLVKRVAVGLIALTAGCELNFRVLRPRFRGIALYSLIPLACALVCVWTLFFVAAHFLTFCATMTEVERGVMALLGANVLIALSPSVVMGIVSETRAAGPLTELALSIVVLADLLIAISFSFTDGLAHGIFGSTTGSGGPWALAIHILGSIGAGFAVGAILALFIGRVGQRVSLFTFAVFFVVAEAGEVLHLDPLLTGLAAGLFLENISPVGGARVVHEIEPATMPIFAVFFAVIGAEIHLRLFLRVAQWGLAAAAARAIGIYTGCRIAGPLAGKDRQYATRIPFGLFPQAGIAIALANLLAEKFASSFGKDLSTLVLGTIVVNEMLGPIGWRVTLSRAGEIGKKDTTAPAHGGTPSHAPALASDQP